MATLKSKLKEQLQKEKDLAISIIVKANNTDQHVIALEWLESIRRIEQVCEDRKRY